MRNGTRAAKFGRGLGRLDGITDATFGTLDGYGLWRSADNVYLTGNLKAPAGTHHDVAATGG